MLFAARRLLVFRKALLSRARHWLPSMQSGRLDTPSFRTLLSSSPQLLRLESLFREKGHEIRLVGGVVRDLLLEAEPKDIDIATDCTPDDMVAMFEEHNIRYIPTGLQHGTITVVIDSVEYEITTLRVDRITDGRHAVVDFTKDWKLDALRRDLTINAMSLSLDGHLYDYFSGQQHLAEKRVVFVGDAETRIREDYLRILRYFRFYGRIVPEAGRHEAGTLEAIREMAEGLRGVSVERVWLEMQRILVGNHAPHIVGLMYELKVADCIGLPKDCNQAELLRVWAAMREHGHTLQPVTMLMTLVHSVGEAYDLAHKWKLSNAEKRLGVFVVEQRDEAYSPSAGDKFYQDLLVDGVPLSSVLELLYYCDHSDMAEELGRWKLPNLPVNGRDLKTVGVSPGRELGDILRTLTSRWKDSGFSLSKEELIAMVPELRKR